jgi:hypothetical protein
MGPCLESLVGVDKRQDEVVCATKRPQSCRPCLMTCVATCTNTWRKRFNSQRILTYQEGRSMDLQL